MLTKTLLAICLSLPGTASIVPDRPDITCELLLSTAESPLECRIRLTFAAAYDKSGYLNSKIDQIIADQCLSEEEFSDIALWRQRQRDKSPMRGPQ